VNGEKKGNSKKTNTFEGQPGGSGGTNKKDEMQRLRTRRVPNGAVAERKAMQGGEGVQPQMKTKKCFRQRGKEDKRGQRGGGGIPEKRSWDKLRKNVCVKKGKKKVRNTASRKELEGRGMGGKKKKSSVNGVYGGKRYCQRPWIANTEKGEKEKGELGGQISS